MGRIRPAVFLRRGNQTCGQTRNEEEGHSQGEHEGGNDGQGLVPKDPTRNPLDEEDGGEDRNGRQGRGGDGRSDLADSAQGRFQRRVALIPAPSHGFQDHDGIVHEHSHGQGQSP